MKVVVSGSNGFVGSNLIKVLGEEYQFAGLERDDFYDEELVKSLFKNADVFIHLAGISSIAECEKNLVQAFQVNVALADYLVELYYRINPKGRVIFVSTGQVYDEKIPAPFAEDSPVAPANAYSKTKLAAESSLRVIAQAHSAELIILRLFNISHKSQAANFFLPSVYQQLSQSIDKKVTVTVGNIDIRRDFSALQDVILILDFLIQAQSLKEKITLINVCSGVSKSLRSLIIGLAKKLEKDIEIISDPAKQRTGEIQEHVGASRLDPLRPILMGRSEDLFLKSFLEDLKLGRDPKYKQLREQFFSVLKAAL